MFLRVFMMFSTTATLACDLLAQVSASARLAGSILGDDNIPVRGARVSYKKLPVYGRDRGGRSVLIARQQSGVVSVGTDGAFAISGLSPGRYHLCALPPTPDLLSDCTWDAVPVLDVLDGQVIVGIRRKIYQSTRVTIRVQDPRGRIDLLDRVGRVAVERRFFPGVYAGDVYRAAHLVEATSTEKTYRLSVPKSRSLKLFVDTDLLVRDEIGRAIEPRKAIDLSPQVFETNDIGVLLSIAQ